MSIVTVIPALNAENTISEIIQICKIYVDGVIVVDDGSIDNTYKISKLNGAHVISLPTTKGKGFALRVGFKEALLGNYKIITTIDGDGENDPTDLLKLIYIINNNNVDAVLGSRINTHSSLILGFKTTKYLIHEYFDISVDDPMCGVRAYRSYVIKYLLSKLQSDSFGIDLEIIFHLLNSKFKYIELPISGNDLIFKSGFKIGHIESFINNLLIFKDNFNAKFDLDVPKILKQFSSREPITVKIKNKIIILKYNMENNLYELSI